MTIIIIIINVIIILIMTEIYVILFPFHFVRFTLSNSQSQFLLKKALRIFECDDLCISTHFNGKSPTPQDRAFVHLVKMAMFLFILFYFILFILFILFYHFLLSRFCDKASYSYLSFFDMMGCNRLC